MRYKNFFYKTIVFFIIGILFFSFFQSGFANEVISKSNTPHIPGDMKGEFPILEWNNVIENRKNNEYIESSYNDDIASFINEIDELMILGYLENLTSFGPRVTASAACDDAGEYIYNEFLEMGLDARKHQWEYYDLYGDNIEATLPGINESSDEIYIICAHYDSVPGSPGADDDGSGTAAVMAAAKTMSQHFFDHTIKFVAFSGEEQGLYGSFFYVQEANASDDNIIAVLNVDMIGFALTENDASNIKVYENEESNWITVFTEDVAEQYYDDIGLQVINNGYSWGSDHYYFWEAGYNAIFYAEYNFNDYYHSPNDIIENMNIPYAVNCTKLIVTTLAELADFKSEPFTPSVPIGNSNGDKGIEYFYTSSTTDPQGDQIFYLFDWDDRTDSGWLGPFPSGTEVNASHTWDRQGNFDVRFKAKDENGYESIWSDPLPVNMPRNYLINMWLNQLIEQFPFLNLIFKNI